MARRIPLLLAVALTGLLAAVLASAPAPATASAGPATTASSASLILGVNVHPEEDLTAAGIYDVADDTEVLNQMQAAGAQMVRLLVPWMWLEPNRPGDYDQTYEQSLDRYVQAVRARGMKLLMVLVGTPCWATSYPGADCVNGDYADGSDAGANYAPAQDTDAGTVAAYIVSRWDPDALEVWNEPDTSDYFEPPPGQDAAAAYTNLVKAIDTAVKATSPSTTIVAGALAQGDTRFLQQLYDDGIAADSDAISIHPYNIDFDGTFDHWGNPELAFADDAEGSFISAVPAIHQVMVQNGDADKPLWITEFGFSACNAGFLCLDEETQAQYLQTSIQAIQAWPYVQVALVDEAWDTDPDENIWNGFGLLRNDFTHTPAYCVYAEATGAQPDCVSDPLAPERAAQDDLTRAWTIAGVYYLNNGASFTGFTPAILSELDPSFSGYQLSSDDEAPSASAEPKLIGIDVDPDGDALTLCNAGVSRAYCVTETTSATPTVARGEAPDGVWAAQSATLAGTSTAWTSASSAEAIAVSLSPGSVPADGVATSTVTATVTDAGGDPVFGAAVSFSSSDPGVQIGPVTDNANGTYSAAVRSSSTPGPVAITATDTSADPAVSGTGTLTQTAVSPPPSTTTSPPPPTATTTTTTDSAPPSTAPTSPPSATSTQPPPPTSTPTQTTPAAPPPANDTPPPAHFASAAAAHLPLASTRLRLSRAGTITLTLRNANRFAVRITRLVLRDGPTTLGALTASHSLRAGGTWRVTLKLSAVRAGRLRRLRAAALALTVTARAPAGDRAASTDHARLIR